MRQYTTYPKALLAKREISIPAVCRSANLNKSFEPFIYIHVGNKKQVSLTCVIKAPVKRHRS